MTTAAPPSGFLHIVVGYDGSPPASRALDAAVRLLRGRTGRLELVYVAHLSSTVMLSAAAIAEMETSFDEIETGLRAQAGEQLRGRVESWGFQRLQGLIGEELIAVAASLRPAGAGAEAGAGAGAEASAGAGPDAGADPDAGPTVVIVVGSSSHAAHRVVGSVAVSLARHSPVPIVIVP